MRGCSHVCDTSTNNDWNTDMGASSHMTPHWHWIQNYQTKQVPIKLPDDTTIYSEGVGSVPFELWITGRTRKTLELHWVLHVPKIQNNLLSVIHLTWSGPFNVTISSQKMEFCEDGNLRIIARLNDNNSAFLEGLTKNNSENTMSILTLPIDITLWHRRFRHHHHARICESITKGLVTGINLQSHGMQDPICEPCLAGKMHANVTICSWC